MTYLASIEDGTRICQKALPENKKPDLPLMTESQMGAVMLKLAMEEGHKAKLPPTDADMARKKPYAGKPKPEAKRKLLKQYVLDLIEEQPGLTTSQIAETLGRRFDSVSGCLNRCKRLGIVRREKIVFDSPNSVAGKAVAAKWFLTEAQQ